MNGLVKGFWKVAGRDDATNKTFTKGADVRLSDESRRKINENVHRMSSTSAYSSAFKNVLEYALVPACSLTKCQRDAMRCPTWQQMLAMIVCALCARLLTWNGRTTSIHVHRCRAKSQTMEDKLTWTDTVSVCALKDANVHPKLLEMWGHLRTAVVYFMRYQEGQHSDELINEAQDALLKYAQLVEATWNYKELATHNLHTCMLHVPEQARACGATAFAGEWWLERLMQVFKRTVKYRCTRYPETTAVQHWLTLTALDDMRLRSPGVTRLLDSIRAGRPTTLRDSTSGDNWLSGKMEKATPAVRAEVSEAFASVDQNACGDSAAVTCTLDAQDLNRVHGTVRADGKRDAVVELWTSNAATIKNGGALVRTAAKQISKQDCYAFVPYSTEDTPASTAAVLAGGAAEAVRTLQQALSAGTAGQQCPRVDAAAAAAAGAAQAANAQLKAAEQGAGYNAAAHALTQAVATTAQAASEAVAAAEQLRYSAFAEHAEERLAAVQRTRAAATECAAVAASLPLECNQPASRTPPSMCGVLHIQRLLKWTQTKDGTMLTRRLAIGKMHDLTPVADKLQRYSEVYCDGSRGRSKQFPTMLQPTRGRNSYTYAVWLSQIECAMVKYVDARGTVFYVPTNKLSLRG